MKVNRTKNSIRNSIFSTIFSIISMSMGFITQPIFISILGAEYLGLNGLFSNILTMLSFFELGIGSAIVANLYKPIAEDNKEKVKSLMMFYKKTYRIVASVVLFIGMAILPFIKYIVGEVSVEINIYVIYFMFLINTVCSYLFSYKKNYLYANQKNYIIGFFNIAFKILVNIIQISLLIIKRNYYIYLAINIILQIAENLLITIYVNKKYPILIEKNVKKLDKNTEKDIFKKVKALILHKIGTIVINGTDNIIISTFLGVVTVGYYSNYYTIISAVKVIFVQLITSITASVGNLICTENKTKCFEVFKRIRFLTFWLATFSSVSILVIMEPFIKIWVGEQFVLPVIVLVSLVFNYFQSVMRTSYSVFKDAAGIWYEDRFVPLIESITNIIFSIILLKIFGLAGVFMGTCVSGLVLWCYSYPKFVYKKIFERQYYSYIKESLGYVFLFTIISIFTYYISNLLVAPNNYLQVIINSIICILIPNGILIIIFRKTENFKYFVSIIKNLVNNFKINNEKI